MIAYAERIAKNDPFQLRMIKLAVNQMQDTQGFHGHITAAHLAHIVSSEGERDPDYALKVPEGRRRPMVERAFRELQATQGRHAVVSLRLCSTTGPLPVMPRLTSS